MKKLVVLIGSLLAFVGFSYLVLFIISSMYSPQADHVPFLNDHRVISQEIEQYRPIFKKYAEVNGIRNDTDLLMAIAMQETRGRLTDIMQSSESQGLPRNSIHSPQQSIEAGARYFSKTLKKSEGNIALALQSYNFGAGFSDYVSQHGGKFTPQLAQQYSKLKAKELGWKSYGDPDYVAHVMRYYENEKLKEAWAKKQN
ncbi:lysozyme family protein [Sporolactobacillus pectinivorans]|uniref:lysozyme family protein n=1 Tax=Sporolactobacillus pectinivorans TaxID=1591408 RepID=UPI000C263DE3|nr:lysozyme family protein [Sporolactobacillus pectinivorans]